MGVMQFRAHADFPIDETHSHYMILIEQLSVNAAGPIPSWTSIPKGDQNIRYLPRCTSTLRCQGDSPRIQMQRIHTCVQAAAFDRGICGS
jgi:hypothetical protein